MTSTWKGRIVEKSLIEQGKEKKKKKKEATKGLNQPHEKDMGKGGALFYACIIYPYIYTGSIIYKEKSFIYSHICKECTALYYAIIYIYIYMPEY